MKAYEFPKVEIEQHEGIFVVREDKLEGGSKRRFIDRYIREEMSKGANEFVFGGCPATDMLKCHYLYKQNNMVLRQLSLWQKEV